MPTPLVKSILGIYSSDEENPISIDNLFSNIINIILSNGIFPINQDASLINNLNTYVFPYYQDLLNNIIPFMKTVIDNYNRFILNEGRYITIMKELINVY